MKNQLLRIVVYMFLIVMIAVIVAWVLIEKTEEFSNTDKQEAAEFHRRIEELGEPKQVRLRSEIQNNLHFDAIRS